MAFWGTTVNWDEMKAIISDTLYTLLTFQKRFQLQIVYFGKSSVE